MSINSILSGLNGSLNNYHVQNSRQAQSIQRISTGSRYPSAAYGPSDYAINVRTYNNIGAVEQSNQNTQNSNAMLSTAAGAVGSTVDNLTSLRESIVNAMNGTNSDSDLATLQKGVDQTISAVNDNASVTYNGKRLLDGGQTVTTAGWDGYTTTTLGNMSAQGLGLVDSEGNSTINLTDRSSLSSALDTVDKALNSALDQATSIGAAQQGLGYQSANYTTQAENLYATAAANDDTDLAAESVENASANTQSQTALWAIKQGLNNLSQQTAGALGGLNNHSRGAALSMLMN